jgi:hypothetical protein
MSFEREGYLDSLINNCLPLGKALFICIFSSAFLICSPVLGADDTSSPDCLPRGSVTEIEALQGFGTSSIDLLKRIPSHDSPVKPLAKDEEKEEPKAKVDDSSSTKSPRKTADIEVLIGLMSGAIEERWEEKLGSVSKTLIRSIGFEDQLRTAQVEFNKNGGGACQSDSDLFACGKLEVVSLKEGISCEVELLDAVDLESAHFKAPQQVSFPSYALTCHLLDESGEILSSKRIYFDPNSNVEEEVQELKKRMKEQ